MYRVAIGVLAATLLGCDTAPLGNAPMGNPLPAEPCYRSYFNYECRIGFNPPLGSEHRFVLHPLPSCSGTAIGSTEDKLTVIQLSSVGYACQDLESFVAEQVQLSGEVVPFHTIVRNEPFMLDSGQDGWLIVTSGLGFTRVTCLTVGSYAGCVLLTAQGTTSLGTGDLDYLLGISRTLCAE